MTTDDSPAVILDSHSHVVWSDVVAEEYQLSVWLPPSYASSTDTYPVLYVLDGPMTFGFAAQGTLNLIFGELVPEVIVVAVGQPLASAYDWGPNRARDYAAVAVPDDPSSGHGAEFAECLRTELVPFVDRSYRTDTTDRALWGHSYGGVFALYLLLERPGLFHRFIATSPGVVDQGVAQLDTHNWPPVGSALPARLFVSVGSADHEYRPHIESFITQLRERNYSALRFESAVLPGLGHIEAAATGFLAGLAAIYADSASVG